MSNKMDIIWIGISEKPGLDPLSSKSVTGKLILEIEENFKEINSYKTNLVKSAPLTSNGKLRYPNKIEINNDFPILLEELETYSPKLIFMLGNLVSSNLEKKIGSSFQKWNGFKYTPTYYNNMYFVSVHHPSYISVYKKKEKNIYMDNISNLISNLCNLERIN